MSHAALPGPGSAIWAICDGLIGSELGAFLPE